MWFMLGPFDACQNETFKMQCDKVKALIHFFVQIRFKMHTDTTCITSSCKMHHDSLQKSIDLKYYKGRVLVTKLKRIFFKFKDKQKIIIKLNKRQFMMILFVFISTVVIEFSFASIPICNYSSTLNEHLLCRENFISTTGGGVIEKGKDLILSHHKGYDYGHWTTCKWRRYGNSRNQYGEPMLEYCMFAGRYNHLDQSGIVFKLNCKPSDFMEKFHWKYFRYYFKKSKCEIKIASTSEDDIVTWSVSLHTDFDGKNQRKKTFAIATVTPLESAIPFMYPYPVQLSRECAISCTIIEGPPKGVSEGEQEISIIFGTVSEKSRLVINESLKTQQLSKIEHGMKNYINDTTIIPRVKNNRRTIDCVAIQRDNNVPKQILFKDIKGMNESLYANRLAFNIRFSPQSPRKNETYTCEKNSTASIAIMIHANPKPDAVIWSIEGKNYERYTLPNSTDTRVLLVGFEYDDFPRYTLYNLTEYSDSAWFVANLTIKDIKDSDQKNYYVWVVNEMGMSGMTYAFSINVIDDTPPNDPSEQAETIILFIVVFVLLIANVVIVYRKYFGKEDVMEF